MDSTERYQKDVLDNVYHCNIMNMKIRTAELELKKCGVIFPENRLKVKFFDALHDEIYLQYFMDFLNTECAVHYITFLIDISKIFSYCVSDYDYKFHDLQNTVAKSSNNTLSELNSLCLPNNIVAFTKQHNTNRKIHFIKKDQNRNPCDTLKNCDLVCNYTQNESYFTLFCLKYFLEDSSLACSLNDELKQNICNEINNYYLSIELLHKIEKFVLNKLEEKYYTKFLKSKYYSLYLLHVFSKKPVLLHDVLNCNDALFHFMEYLEEQNSSRLLEFWLVVNNLIVELDNSACSICQEDAVALFNRFLSLQAPSHINFSDTLRIRIEKQICQEQGITINYLIKLKLIIELTLQKYFFPNFVESSWFLSFFKILSEDKNISKPDFSKKSPSINCIDFKDKKKKFNKLSNSLSFSFINQLGQYHPQFEPIPLSSSNEWNVGQSMRKLLHSRSHNEEVENAWKEAEKIIKDITNVTLQS